MLPKQTHQGITSITTCNTFSTNPTSKIKKTSTFNNMENNFLFQEVLQIR